jgi:hypothetical protein
MAEKIVSALHDARAFRAYLECLPDDARFQRRSITDCPVAHYLRDRTGADCVRVFAKIATWQEGDRYNQCLLPREFEQFVHDFSGRPDTTAHAARELWARLTSAPQPN